MISRISSRVEKALREAMEHVAHAEADQIEAPLAALDEAERTEALSLAILITGYVIVDVCGSQWPDDGGVRRLAQGLATVGTTARRLQLNADEIYRYLSRIVLGPEPLEDVIPDEPMFTRLPVIVAQRAAGVYAPKDMSTWEYLDQIESAIETALAIDATVLPAAVLRAYLPKPDPGGQ